MPDVSIIIPTYNRAPLLPVALESILAQTTEATLEVLVSDDGSTDNTAAVIQPYLKRHSDPSGRVLIRYTQLAKQGVIVARNTGIAATTAPLVAFLDSDDYWHPHKLERQLALLADPAVGVVHTAFFYVDDAGRPQSEAPERRNNPCTGRCGSALLDEDRVIFSSVVMRRAILDAIRAGEPHGQFFDPRFTCGEDYDLLLRAALHGAFGYVAEGLTYYRVHASQTGMDNLPRVFGYHCRVQMDFAKRHGAALGITEAEGRRRAAAFLLSRVEALFWQRRFAVALKLCALARELDLHDERFATLETKLHRPAWLYRVKDFADRLRGKR